MVDFNWPELVSNLTTTNEVDDDVKKDDGSQSFENTIKQNHSANKICDTNTTTTQVQIKFHSHLCQQITSTTTTSLTLPPYGKEYLCFLTDIIIPGKHSVTNKVH